MDKPEWESNLEGWYTLYETEQKEHGIIVEPKLIALKFWYGWIFDWMEKHKDNPMPVIKTPDIPVLEEKGQPDD